jgi:VWFA-related protein
MNVAGSFTLTAREVGVFVAMTFLALIAGCSSTAPPTVAAVTASPVAAATAVPPLLDLCTLPALAPANLRAKPGYVEFAVSVLDANGAPITGLKQADFTLSDGAKPVSIAYFRETSATTPASLFIVGDASVTMFNKTVVKSRRLSELREQLDRGADDINQCDEVGVVVGGGSYLPHFDPSAYELPPSLSEFTLLQPFTTEHAAAMFKIENVVPSGPSHLPDAIKLALAQLGDAHYPNRALAIMTDGLDGAAIDASVAQLEQVRAKGIGVWVIGIGDPDAGNGAFSSLTGTTRLETAAVRRLAAAGGGQVLFAQPVDTDGGASLARAISTVGKQLGQGYVIGAVTSPNAAPLAVTLANPAGKILRAAVVPSQVLADAASRPSPPAHQVCVDATVATPPAVISAKPGYTQVRVSVVDTEGKALLDLSQSDFEVTGSSGQLPIAYFHEDRPQTPSSVVIAIDTSGSMKAKLPTVRRELGKLIAGLNPCDEVTLLAFAGRVYVLQKFTTDHHLVERRLSLLHAYGPTALYDAIDASLTMLSKASYRNRALVLLTDGLDNSGGTSSQDVLETVAHDGIPIYAIGIGRPVTAADKSVAQTGVGAEDVVDQSVLNAIAFHSGGKDYLVPPMSQDQGQAFASAVAAVGQRLNHGYQVGFIAPEPGLMRNIMQAKRTDYVVRLVHLPVATTPAAPK